MILLSDLCFDAQVGGPAACCDFGALWGRCPDPRAERPDGRLQVGNLQVGVDRRRLQIAVAEQLLNVPDTRSPSQQVSRAAVTEEVDIGFQIEPAGVAFDWQLDHRIGEPEACPRQPERLRRRRRKLSLDVADSQFAPRLRQLSIDPIGRVAGQRHDPILFSFACAHHQPPDSHLQVIEVQLPAFMMTDARGVEHLHQRPIAQPDGREHIRGFNQSLDLRFDQDPWQSGVSFW